MRVIELGGYPWRFIDTAGNSPSPAYGEGAEFLFLTSHPDSPGTLRSRSRTLDVSDPLSEQDVRIIQTTIDSVAPWCWLSTNGTYPSIGPRQLKVTVTWHM